MTALLLGAGGFLGLNLFDALRDAGWEPQCGVRRRAVRGALRRRNAQTVFADLDDPDSLDAAMAGRSVVFHAAGHYPANSLDPVGSLARGLRQTRAVLDAAARTGVRRLVYLSTIATAAPASRSSTEADVFSRPPGFGLYHDLKWAMEQEVLSEDRFEVAVACPGACLGPWDLRVGTSSLIVAVARGWPLAVPQGIVNLVDARDVALAAVRLGRMAIPPRRVLLAEGDYPMGSLMQRLARRYGALCPTVISASAARTLADAEERRCQHERGRPALVRELVDLIVHGVSVDTSLSRNALGLRYRPLADTLDAYDAWARAHHILPPRPELTS